MASRRQMGGLIGLDQDSGQRETRQKGFHAHGSSLTPRTMLPTFGQAAAGLTAQWGALLAV